MTAFHGASGVPARSWTSGESARLRQVEPRRDAVERLERERDLDQVGVAGALAHAVDRALHPRRAGLDRGDGAAVRQAEVVVAVPVDRDLAAEPVDGLADEIRRRLGRRDADRVDDHDLLRAGLDRASRRRAGRSRAPRARSRRRRKRRLMPVVGREETALAIRSSIFSRETPSASSFRPRSGSRSPRPDAQLDERLDVGLHGAREPPDLCAEAGGAISSTARQSSAETRGKPASMRSMPAASSARRSRACPRASAPTPTDCSPSRSVVS